MSSRWRKRKLSSTALAQRERRLEHKKNVEQASSIFRMSAVQEKRSAIGNNGRKSKIDSVVELAIKSASKPQKIRRLGDTFIIACKICGQYKACPVRKVSINNKLNVAITKKKMLVHYFCYCSPESTQQTHCNVETPNESSNNSGTGYISRGMLTQKLPKFKPFAFDLSEPNDTITHPQWLTRLLSMQNKLLLKDIHKLQKNEQSAGTMSTQVRHIKSTFSSTTDSSLNGSASSIFPSHDFFSAPLCNRRRSGALVTDITLKISCKVDIVWPDDAQWHTAIIQRLRPCSHRKRHPKESAESVQKAVVYACSVKFEESGVLEELDLRFEDYGAVWKHHGIDALVPYETCKTSCVKETKEVKSDQHKRHREGKGQVKIQKEQKGEEMNAKAVTRTWKRRRVPMQQRAIHASAIQLWGGCMVDILWPDNQQWYHARIKRMRPISDPASMDEYHGITEEERLEHEMNINHSFVLQYSCDESIEELSLSHNNYGTLWKHYRYGVAGFSNRQKSPKTTSPIINRHKSTSLTPTTIVRSPMSEYECVRAQRMAQNKQAMNSLFGIDHQNILQRSSEKKKDLEEVNIGEKIIEVCTAGSIIKLKTAAQNKPAIKAVISKRPTGEGNAASFLSVSAPQFPPIKKLRKSNRQHVNAKRFTFANFNKRSFRGKKKLNIVPKKLPLRSNKVKLKIQFDGPNQFIL